jgi:hypothetical protein
VMRAGLLSSARVDEPVLRPRLAVVLTPGLDNDKIQKVEADVNTYCVIRICVCVDVLIDII